MDPVSLRPLTGPVLANAVENWPAVAGALKCGSERLESTGMTAPLDAPGIFHVDRQGRKAIRFSDNLVMMPGGNMNFARAAEAIRMSPERFSPNAALRPVLQDAVIPVAAIAGGPSELAYLAQVDPVYKVLSVRRSVPVPRISATFIPERIDLLAGRLGLNTIDMFDAEKLEIAGSGNDSLTGEIDRTMKKLDSALCMFEKDLADRRWLDRGRKNIAVQVEKLKKRIRESELEKSGITRTRLKKIKRTVIPHGKPQERVENVMSLLNRHGPVFVESCMDSLDAESTKHQVVHIKTQEA